ncbi:MAG: exonuclease SbcCD subunit D [Bacteroidaceae bacterium]|nr:exonuclease SbcCD subunit D [Bacteroidaceae bacterium]
MKILHTSDWHLGHLFYNYDRSEEQQDFLCQLARIVAQEQPDVMVVSGDVFHYSSPSATAQRMYTEAILDIHQACPEMEIVLTAGNHDSSSKLEVDRKLWKHFSVHVVGKVEGTDLDKHIIPIKDKGFVIAVPHVYPQNFPLLEENTPREERCCVFFQHLLNKVKEENVAGLPVVLMAHLAITGSDSTGHDEPIGGMDFTPITALGEGYDYLALGHIHCPQDIKDNTRHARYSGTPLPVSFDEQYPHSITLVEIDKQGATPIIRTVPIHNPKPLIIFPSQPTPFEEVLKELEGFDSDLPAYLQINVLVKDFLAPDCNERISQVLKDKRCRFCHIKMSWEQTTTCEQLPRLSLQEMKEISPTEIAKLYYQEKFGKEMDDELCTLFNEALALTQMEKL